MLKLYYQPLKNSKKLHIVPLLVAIMHTNSAALAADIHVDSSVSAIYNFEEDGQKISVGDGGDIYYEDGGIKRSTIDMTSKFRNLEIEVDTGDISKGIRALNTNSAIDLRNTAGDLLINVKSGIIESRKYSSPTITFRSNDAADRLNAVISVSSGAKISNTVDMTASRVIFQGINTDLTINNSGTISSNDHYNIYYDDEHSYPGVIAAEDASGFMVINNNAGGIIAANYDADTDNGTALSAKSNNLDVTINNASSAQITGGLVFSGTQTSIVNQGVIYGDILANKQSLPGSWGNYAAASLNLVNDGGQIIGDVYLADRAESSLINDGGSISGDIYSYDDAQSINLMNSSITNGNVSFDGAVNFDGNNTINGNINATSSQSSVNLGSGSQNIYGDLNLQDGNTLSFSFAQDGSAGDAQVSGAAIIPSGTKLGVDIQSAYSYITDGSQYTIIEGGAGSSIDAISNDNINVNNLGSNNFSVLTFSTTVSAEKDTLYVNVARAEAGLITDDINARNVYNNINAIGANAQDELQDLQQFIDTSSSARQVEQALHSTTPQSDNAIKMSAIETIGKSVSTVENRLDTLHLASAKARKAYKAANKGNYKLRRPSMSKSSCDSGVKSKNGMTVGKGCHSGIASGDAPQSKAIWGQAFGTKAKQSNQNNNGYDSRSVGFAFGADTEISPNTRLGVSVSYADSTITSADKMKSTMVDTYQLNVYGGHSFDRYFIDGVVGFVLNDYTSHRYISSVDVGADSDYQGQSYVAKVRGGLTHTIGQGFTITPEISMNFVRNVVDGYVEKNAGTLNLNVGKMSNDVLEGRIGFELGYESQNKNDLTFVPSIHASYGYDFLNENQTTVSNFVGQTTTFNTISSNNDPRSIEFGGSLDIYKIQSNVLNVGYKLNKRNRYSSHSGFLRIRNEF